MNDKELLELATKAAGIEVVWLESSFYGPTMARVEVKNGEEEITEPWNPLTDDGDALRLAVSLGVLDGGNRYLTLRTEEIGNGHDPYAATRRAIVRVAAEIGKNKE